MGEGREEEEFEGGGQNGLLLSTDWECSHLGWKEGGGEERRKEERRERRRERREKRERRERVNLVCLKHELT